MTATTGVAAVQLGGCTLHHAFNIPIDTCNTNVTRQRWDINALRAIDVLVIDEVSLCSAELIDALDMEARLARMNVTPFGGIQVIACGDFLQLSNNAVLSALPAYEGEAFKHLIHVKLVTPMRHSEGDPLLDLLTDLRCGRFNAKTFASLDRPVCEDA
uniref:ATP-dependent DNA helicase n=1 Tax=Lygus hesperus TaxID=30085 RepID=A0A0A9WG40_LYGHE